MSEIVRESLFGNRRFGYSGVGNLELAPSLPASSFAGKRSVTELLAEAPRFGNRGFRIEFKQELLRTSNYALCTGHFVLITAYYLLPTADCLL